MITKKRDQPHHDLVQQYLSGLTLNTILGIIPYLGNPYDAKPGLGGMAAYPPMAMGIVCIMLEAERTTYRKMVDMLRNNHAMAARMGLKKIPSKSTIACSYGLIPEWYPVHVHQTVIREVEAGSLAGDSTGFSYLRFVRWFDVRADKFRAKKGWVKMHAIVDIRTRVMIDYLVTDSVAADINGLYVMLHRLGLGMFCLDSAYLTRDMCDMISAMGMISRIKPKSNTVRNAKGSQPWRGMVDLYMDDREAFDSEYHRRSVMESVFAALKKMYGDCTRSHSMERSSWSMHGPMSLPSSKTQRRCRSECLQTATTTGCTWLGDMSAPLNEVVRKAEDGKK